jgi:hypothetical protein
MLFPSATASLPLWQGESPNKAGLPFVRGHIILKKFMLLQMIT